MVAPLVIEWGSAERALPGESTIGDRCAVLQYEGGALVAVIDGLGHGAAAAAAAELAVSALARDPTDSVIGLVRRAHDALQGSRGAAMSLAAIDTRRRVLTWLGVGNVHGVLLHNGPSSGRAIASALVTRGGVVGSALPYLRAEVIGIGSGDILVFATDGVESAFSDTLRPTPRHPREWAEHLLSHNAKATDDALVFVLRATDGGHT